ncbi:hypothetical protein D3C79_536650 [compost metagenome]
MLADLRLGVGGVAKDRAAWPLPFSFIGTYSLGELVAIDRWHVAVKYQHIECLLPPQAQPRQAVISTAMLQAQVVQLLGHQQQVGRVVIDHQYLQCSNGDAGLRRHYRFVALAAHQRHRHADMNAGTQAKHTVQRQATAHQPTQVAADRQAQSRTAACETTVGVGLGERQEQALLILFVNADAAVLYCQLKPGRA